MVNILILDLLEKGEPGLGDCLSQPQLSIVTMATDIHISSLSKHHGVVPTSCNLFNLNTLQILDQFGFEIIESVLMSQLAMRTIPKRIDLPVTRENQCVMSSSRNLLDPDLLLRQHRQEMGILLSLQELFLHSCRSLLVWQLDESG